MRFHDCRTRCVLLALLLAAPLAGCDSEGDDAEALPSITGIELTLQGLGPDGVEFPLDRQTITLELVEGVFAVQDSATALFVESRSYIGEVAFTGEQAGADADVMDVIENNKDRFLVDFETVGSSANDLFFTPTDDDGNGLGVGLRFSVEVDDVPSNAQGGLFIRLLQFASPDDKPTLPIGGTQSAFLEVLVRNID